jgi:hypothetical protein
MKKNIFALCFLLALPATQYAQEINAQELLDKILKLEPIINYKSFKVDLEAEVAEISAVPMSLANYEALQSSYNSIKINSDKFIGLIKQDILDFKNIKKMAKNGDVFVAKYADAFNAAGTIHSDEFMPLVKKIRGQERFAIMALLAPLGKMAFDGIVSWIRNKRIDKDELMGDLLQIVNVSFVDKLKMKPWAAIAAEHKPLISKGNGNTPAPAPTPNNNKGKKKSAPVVDYPTTKGLSGTITFRMASGDKMPFKSQSKQSRDIGIGTLNSENGAAEGIFTSSKTYSEGSQFQIETENTGLIYVFAFNSDGTCFPIYPYSADWVKGYGMSKKRDITINPLMLKNEQTGGLTIPSPRADTGGDNYITISGNSKKEQICVIVTKSELDFKALLSAINESEGSLAERVAEAIGVEPQGYENLSLSDSTFSFDLDEAEMPVLPLIFEIRR